MGTGTTVIAGPGDTWQAQPPGQPDGLRVARGVGWRVAGAVLSVVLVATGVLSTASWLARHTEVGDSLYEQAVSRVEVDTGAGNVEVAPGPADQVRVHRHLTWGFTRPVLHESRSGGTLRLWYECSGASFFGVGCDVDYRLVVPTGVALTIVTASGDVDVAGVRGAMDVDTASGGISVADAVGNLSLHTASGDVAVERSASARTTAHTASGNVTIDLTARPDAVEVGTASGDVSLTVPDGSSYQVDTETASGGTAIGVPRANSASASLSVTTDSGNISIGPG